MQLSSCPTLSVFNCDKYFIFPGFCDVHVHFREPGFSYKETIFSGSNAAARGGYTAVCTMPNLNPVPDNADNLSVQTDIIDRDARDMNRELSPLRQAEDAVLLDTSRMTFDEVIDEMEEMIEDAGSKGCCGC